jgi:hypothetical protein
MTWFILTLKQHRFEVLATVLVSVALVSTVFVEIYQLNSVYWPKGCSSGLGYGIGMMMASSDPCTQAVQSFDSIRNGPINAVVQAALILTPFFAGIMMGAPVVSRELEQNTAPLTWALIGSRRLWLGAVVATLLVVFVPSMIAIGFSADALYGATNPGSNPWTSLAEYGLRGAPVVFWGLAAFFGTLLLGVVFGRSLPAIFLALIICLFARLGGEYVYQSMVLAPYAQPLMTWQQLVSPDGNSSMQTALVIDWREWADGKPLDSSSGQPGSPGMTATPTLGTGSLSQQSDIQLMPYGFTGSMYWPVVATECVILAGGSLLFSGIAFYVIGRRRPY